MASKVKIRTPAGAIEQTFRIAEHLLELAFKLIFTIIRLVTHPKLWRAVWFATVTTGRHHKLVLAPWITAGALVGIAVVAHHVAHPVLVAAGAAAGCIFVSALYARQLEVLGRKELAMSLSVLVGAWTGWACLSDGVVLRLTGIGIFGLTANCWWTRYRRTKEIPSLITAAGSLAAAWALGVAPTRIKNTLVLPGEKPIIVGGKRVGVEGIIQIGAGSTLTASQIISSSESVAAGLQLPPISVVLDGTDEGRADQIKIQRLDDNPLHKIIPWVGSDFSLETGMSSIGVHPNGTLAEYVWSLVDGPWHDLFAGTTGAGKSALLSLLLSTSRSANGAIVDWIGDPQNGQSFPDWMDHVDRAAKGRDECIEMLYRTRDVMYERNKQLAEWPWMDDKGRARCGYDAFPWMKIGMPLLVVTIDEAHAILSEPDVRKVAEDIAKMARKCGIKLRLVVQVPLLDQLGGSTTLRDMVASGNVVVFRTANRLSGAVAFNGNLPVDPAAIPRAFPGKGPIESRRTQGVGYLLGANSSAAPMRTYKVGDALDYALAGSTAHLDEVSMVAAGSWPPAEDAVAVRQAQAVPTYPGEEDEPKTGPARDRVIEILRKYPKGRMPTDLAVEAGCSAGHVYKILGDETTFTKIDKGTYGLVETSEGEAA